MPERYNACCERVGSTSCDAGPQTNPPRESASSTEAASPWRSCVRRLAAAVRPRVTMTARVEGASGSKMQAPELRAVPRLRGSPSLASCLAKWILRIHPAQQKSRESPWWKSNERVTGMHWIRVQTCKFRVKTRSKPHTLRTQTQLREWRAGELVVEFVEALL